MCDIASRQRHTHKLVKLREKTNSLKKKLSRNASAEIKTERKKRGWIFIKDLCTRKD
jgi:hypothetical protein